MLSILFEAHSGWRYIVIAVAVVVFLRYLIGLIASNQWTTLDQRLGLAYPIVVDIQVLMGLVLWLMAPGAWFQRGTATVGEHLVTMLLVLGVAHMGWARIKRAEVDAVKFRTGVIFYAISGLLLALGVARITGVM